jgi:hypothetical protein
VSGHPLGGGIVRDSEVWGIEFDWFAVDRSGRVALFASAGSGQVPPQAVALDSRYEHLFTHLSIPHGRDTWRRAVDAGLFAYDCSINGGPYRLEGSPSIPITAEQLPPEHRRTVEAIAYIGQFGAPMLEFEPGAFCVSAA